MDASLEIANVLISDKDDTGIRFSDKPIHLPESAFPIKMTFPPGLMPERTSGYCKDELWSPQPPDKRCWLWHPWGPTDKISTRRRYGLHTLELQKPELKLRIVIRASAFLSHEQHGEMLRRLHQSDPSLLWDEQSQQGFVSVRIQSGTHHNDLTTVHQIAVELDGVTRILRRPASELAPQPAGYLPSPSGTLFQELDLPENRLIKAWWLFRRLHLLRLAERYRQQQDELRNQIGSTLEDTVDDGRGLSNWNRAQQAKIERMHQHMSNLQRLVQRGDASLKVLSSVPTGHPWYPTPSIRRIPDYNRLANALLNTPEYILADESEAHLLSPLALQPECFLFERWVSLRICDSVAALGWKVIEPERANGRAPSQTDHVLDRTKSVCFQKGERILELTINPQAYPPKKCNQLRFEDEDLFLSRRQQAFHSLQRRGIRSAYFSTSDKISPDFLLRMIHRQRSVFCVADATFSDPNYAEKGGLSTKRKTVDDYSNHISYINESGALCRSVPSSGFVIVPGEPQQWSNSIETDRKTSIEAHVMVLAPLQSESGKQESLSLLRRILATLSWHLEDDSFS